MGNQAFFIIVLFCINRVYFPSHANAVYDSQKHSESSFDPNLSEIGYLLIKLDRYNGAMMISVLLKLLGQNNPNARKFVATLVKVKSEEYDFASHGEACHPITKRELSNFINLYSTIFGTVEQQRKISLTVLSEPYEENQEKMIHRKLFLEYLPKLLTLFTTSEEFCDYKKFLICDNVTRKCKCPDDMIASENLKRGNGCCILPGRKCNLTNQELENKAIFVTNKSPQAQCIQNSECKKLVKYLNSDTDFISTKNISFNISNTILETHSVCQCKQNFDGGYCRHLESTSKLLLNDESRLTEYYRMYPEEILDHLIQLMTHRKMYVSKEETIRNAHIAYKHIAMDKFKEVIVENDIFLRRLAHLFYGDSCDYQFQIKIDNPPLSKEGDAWVDPIQNEIISWQKFFIRSSTHLCNFELNLKCNEISKVCVCAEGLILEDGECRIKIGHICGTNYQGTFRFDPLQDLKRFSPPPAPKCVTGTICKDKPLFYSKRCWCEDLTICGTNTGANNSQKINVKMFTSKVFRLVLGVECDPNVEEHLLNPSGEQNFGVEVRQNFLNDIFHSTKIGFCDIRKFYNCSQITKKCECWENFAEQNGTCRLKNMNGCGNSFLFHGTNYYKGDVSRTLRDIEKTFSISFNPFCVHNSTCKYIADNKNDVRGNYNGNERCLCLDPQKTGPYCNESLSNFASVLLFTHDLDSIDNSVFFTLNSPMAQLELFMTLEVQDKCIHNPGLEVVVNFWKDIALYGTNNSNSVTSRKSVYHFQKAATWINFLTRQPSKGFCDARLGLICNKEMNKCECPLGQIFTHGTCRLRVHQLCNVKHAIIISLFNSDFDWIPQCNDLTLCKLSDIAQNSNKIYKCQPCKHTIGSDCVERKRKAQVNVQNSTSWTLNKINDNQISNYMNKELKEIEPKTQSELMYAIHKFLNDILKKKKLKLMQQCDSRANLKFFRLIPRTVLTSNENFREQDFPNGFRKTYEELHNFVQQTSKKLLFCDFQNHQECSPYSHTCVCMHKHHLVQVGGECRLKLNEICGEDQSNAINSHKIILQCEEKSKCVKTDYGPKKCLRV